MRLQDYGFRDYSPRVKRFTTIDPIRDGLNWYVYVGNDPVNFVDPWGLDGEGTIGIVNMPGSSDFYEGNALENYLDNLENGYWSDEDINFIIQPETADNLNEYLETIDENVEAIIFAGGHSHEFFDTEDINVDLDDNINLYFATCEQGLNQENLASSFGVPIENVHLNTDSSYAENTYDFIVATIYSDISIEDAYADYILENDAWDDAWGVDYSDTEGISTVGSKND